MQNLRTSTQTIEIESYITLREEWPDVLQNMVSSRYNARGFRVVDGRTSWQYFATAEEATKWANAIHKEH